MRDVVTGNDIDSPVGGKEVHAADVAKAVAILLDTEPHAVAGQAFNCYDKYIADQQVARIAKDISGSASAIATPNKGPKNEIDTTKLRALGMTFGGEALLRNTIAQLVEAARA